MLPPGFRKVLVPYSGFYGYKCPRVDFGNSSRQQPPHKYDIYFMFPNQPEAVMCNINCKPTIWLIYLDFSWCRHSFLELVIKRNVLQSLMKMDV